LTVHKIKALDVMAEIAGGEATTMSERGHPSTLDGRPCTTRQVVAL
jgi:hypothetical protein